MIIDFKGFLKRQDKYLHYISAIKNALHLFSAVI
jgi:hypothetical protein